MNTNDHLRRQLSYNGWANAETLRAIRAGAGGMSRSLQLMSHIVAAERLWLERLGHKAQSVAVWPEFDIDRCEAEAMELNRLWHDYLNTVEDLLQGVSYKNSKGEPWTSTILDVLTHVVMHSAYHRGQIASHMREIGQAPAYTDYIHAVRQGYVP